MSNFIQTDMLATLPISNVNRSDDGLPKTAMVGDTQRGRISSQAFKRALRTSAIWTDNLGDYVAYRTREIGTIVMNHLASTGTSQTEAEAIAISIVQLFSKKKEAADGETGKDANTTEDTGEQPADTSVDKSKKDTKKSKKDGKKEKSKNPLETGQLIFISNRERENIRRLADELRRDPKKPIEIGDVLLNDDTAVDIAMFGRMVAQSPGYNREAAVQVAHAITTNSVVVEDDFFTAVDDLKNADESRGSAHMGEVGYLPGSVFYFYICINFDLLVRNLSGDRALAEQAVRILLTALPQTTPSGKQSTFATRTRAGYLRVERGNTQPYNGSPAFLKAIKGEDIFELSVTALRSFRAEMADLYNQTVNCVEMYPGCAKFDDVIEFAATGRRPLRETT